MARGAPHAAGTGRPPLGERRSGRAAAVVLSLLVLIGTPVLVVVLASTDDVSSSRARAAVDVPASGDPHRPAAPFFAGVGDGVRPDGIGCSSVPQTAVRARAHLDVFADARAVRVPAGIGVLRTCAYWVRTQAADGVITIGSPQRRAFTVGDFFDIWGAPLTANQMLSFHLTARRPLRAYVDGRRASGDPRAIRLRDGREIALVVGRRPRNVPARFAFPRAG
jgi:hypothetical protein